jgi:hypothetical protein
LVRLRSVCTDATFRNGCGLDLLPWISPGLSPNDFSLSVAWLSSSARCARNRMRFPLFMALAIMAETIVVFPPPVGTQRIERLCRCMLVRSSSIALIWYGLKVCIELVCHQQGQNELNQM